MAAPLLADDEWGGPFALGERAVADEASNRARLTHADRLLAERMSAGAERRREWIAGRAAARDAMARLLGAEAETLAIVRAADGAPEVAERPAIKLSISHSRHTAVAVAGMVARLGVDLCELGDAPRVRRIADRFLAKEENALIAGDAAAAWATLWALKEGGAKAHRRGLLTANGLAATRVISLAPPRFESPALAARVRVGQSHVVAVVWQDECLT